MQQSRVELPEIKLVGIKVRTNNAAEAQFDSPDAKIFPCIQKYFHQKLAEKIAHRKKPGTTFCVYTEYESDVDGDYTYFIGEEVRQLETNLDGFATHIIPPQNYAKFTTDPAPMPEVVRDAWLQIWQMPPQMLGGKRRFHSDFEIYDERAADHENIVMDIYIGLEEQEIDIL